MIDETMPSAASQPQRLSPLRLSPLRSSPLQLPLQAAPIDRTQLPTSAAASDGGVEAAFGWKDLIPIATAALGAL